MNDWPKTMTAATPVQCFLSDLEGAPGWAVEHATGMVQDAGLLPLELERVVPADLAREMYEALYWLLKNPVESSHDWHAARAALARYEREVGS